MIDRRAIALLLPISFAAVGISLFEGVGLKNELDSTVAFELRQYLPHKEAPTRPSAWTDEDLARTVSGELLPGEEEVIAFEGGGWLVWTIRDYGTSRTRCKGELDFTTESSHSLVVDRARCGQMR